MKIGDLNQYSRQINVVVKVISKTDVREVVTRTDETKHKVCEALVADDTGAIYLTLWDEAVDSVQEDQILSVKNAYMNTFKGSMRMNIGRYGSYDVLEEALAGTGLPPELLRGLVVDERVVHAMAGDLVAAGGEPTDKGGVALRHPPEDEEGGSDPPFGQQAEEPIRVRLDPRAEAVPLRTGDDISKCLNLEEVLHIEREGTHERRGGEPDLHWRSHALDDDGNAERRFREGSRARSSSRARGRTDEDHATGTAEGPRSSEDQAASGPRGVARAG